MLNINWDRYNNLGFYSPFYSIIEGKHKFSYNYNDFLHSNNKLDLTAVTQLSNYNYYLGDRTIIQGIKKSPWLSRFNTDKNTFEFDKVFFDSKNKDEKTIVTELYKKLQEEMLLYIGNKRNIGILLSGGMDSRIVLGILLDLIKDEKLDKNINIKAFTWGNKNSRDVIYAKRLADSLNIEIVHYVVDENTLFENIQYVLTNGLEYSPLHLHAMLKIAEDKQVDCILAGSYGDSIGRAQYSGKKIPHLKNMSSRFKNSGKLINPKTYIKTLENNQTDISNYKHIFNQKEEYQNTELEYQFHYMRRMLNPAMMVIQKKIPLYQMFSSPDIYSYMWSLSPQSRKQNIYEGLFKIFKTNLLKIPYAKTGILFNQLEGKPDDYSKDHHIYSEQIKKYFINYIESKLLNGNFFEYGIVNKNVIKTAIKGMKYFNKKKDIYYEDKLLWFAVLAEFIELNNIEVEKNANSYNISGVFEYYFRKFYMN